MTVSKDQAAVLHIEMEEDNVVMEEVVGRETQVVLCDPTAVRRLLLGAD